MDDPFRVMEMEVDVERSKAPHVALAGREHLRAGAGFGWEEGDNVAEDAVGEAGALPLPFSSSWLG
jgi:hypothetical protein